jgi:hypothetical protein
MAICVVTGFSSGLPLFLLLNLLPAWLKTEGIGIREIGFFALIVVVNSRTSVGNTSEMLTLLSLIS